MTFAYWCCLINAIVAEHECESYYNALQYMKTDDLELYVTGRLLNNGARFRPDPIWKHKIEEELAERYLMDRQ